MASVAEALQGTSSVDAGLMVAIHPGGAPEHEKSANVSGASAVERRKGYWPAIEWLPDTLADFSLPIPRFRVRDLLVLDPGQIIATDWPNGDDLPFSVDTVQLAWVEMESVEQEMAVRITRLL